MGTSADLAIRHRGRTFYQHTSYDGHEDNVLSQVIGTLVAAGIETLRARLDQEPEDIRPEEDDLFLDRRAMGNAYLEACRARGLEPVNLDYAMAYEFGNPDFSHGGIIPLLAPAIEWSEGFCHRIEDASFILDLDRECLVVPDWTHQIQDGSYDQGTLEALRTIPWASVCNSDPKTLMRALEETTYDHESPAPVRQAALDAVLASVADGSFASALSGRDAFRPGPRFQDRDEFSPSVHRLRGIGDHTFYQQAVVDFLREQAADMPVFGEPQTLVMERNDDGETVLIVDLRKGDSGRAQNLVGEVFDSLARASGMISEMQSEGQSKNVGVYASAFSSGFGHRDGQEDWDANLVPEDAVPVGLETRKRAMLDQALQDKDERALENAFARAIVGLDEATWHKIEDSGLMPPPDASFMTPFVAMAIESCRHFERGLPGSTASRFSRLSEGQRRAFLGAMEPIDRHMFTQLLGVQAGKASGPRFGR